MGALINLTNRTFGDLRVLLRYPADGERFAYWLCRCRCGQEFAVRSDNLISGHTQTCGKHKRRGDNNAP